MHDLCRGTACVFPEQSEEGTKRIMAFCDTLVADMASADVESLYDAMVSDAGNLDPPVALMSKLEVIQDAGGEFAKEYCEAAMETILGAGYAQKAQEWVLRAYLKCVSGSSDSTAQEALSSAATAAFGLRAAQQQLQLLVPDLAHAPLLASISSLPVRA